MKSIVAIDAGSDQRPLVVHLVYRFGTGGLENGIVNLINHIRADRYRHAVVALTDVDLAFANRIHRTDVIFHAMQKPEGHGFQIYGPLCALFRKWRPSIVHSRNLAPLECQVAAWWSRVPVRIHGEHGRDLDDLDGTAIRYQLMRRVYRPFVHQFVALSRELADYLRCQVGVPQNRISQICNGVDADRFRPAASGRAGLDGSPFNDPGLFVIGTVGRMQPVKAQIDMAAAFIRALTHKPDLRAVLRLVMVGEGPLRREAATLLESAGMSHFAWLPGERSDVPDVMRALDAFVLPSLAEGISNTILEAMASGLPVVATDVGGNGDLIVAGATGSLVPVGDVQAMSDAIRNLAEQPQHASLQGLAGRRRVEQHFSLSAMVGHYQSLYDRLLAGQRLPA